MFFLIKCCLQLTHLKNKYVWDYEKNAFWDWEWQRCGNIWKRGGVSHLYGTTKKKKGANTVEQIRIYG